MVRLRIIEINIVVGFVVVEIVVAGFESVVAVRQGVGIEAAVVGEGSVDESGDCDRLLDAVVFLEGQGGREPDLESSGDARLEEAPSRARRPSV